VLSKPGGATLLLLGGFMNKLQEQLDHLFYKEAEDFREDIKMETMKKASVKYNEPFNPASWTIEQLAKHAMAENYDQQNYIFGMYQRLIEQEKEIERLKEMIGNKNDTIIKTNELLQKELKKPPYADLDD
jgi:predicted N-formylglutamate amidohydrolase